MTRTIQAPGIELREVDKSEYDKQDYSLVGTTALIHGFADKGDNYNINWINTIQNFRDVYGLPNTEEEKWFYNAANEILTRGGILLASKLPYDNIEFSNGDPLIAYTDYQIETEHIDPVTFQPVSFQLSDDFPEIQSQSIDQSLKTYVKISSKDNNHDNSGYIHLSQLDKLKIGQKTELPANTLRIVDLTRQKYGKANITHVDSTLNDVTQSSYECLGLVPIVTTPINALFFQNIISAETIADSSTEITTGLSNYNPAADFSNVKYGTTHSGTPFNFQDENFSMKISSDSIYDITLSKIATSYFPTISYTTDKCLDKQYMKQIGIVLFEVRNDSSTEGKISFVPVEAYLGSLDQNSHDEFTGQTTYIDDVVNNNSQRINVYTKHSLAQGIKTADTICCTRQIATVLGLYESQCAKNIAYQNSINSALNITLDLAKDVNKYNIDLVVDAGLTNIAQKAASQLESVLEMQLLSKSDTAAWRATANKLMTFCQNTRKDCMFIADGLRPFCLEGNQKIVRPTAPQNTVEKKILPKLKYMAGLNSSYSAGYCNWFKSTDAFSGDMIWLPPSIKMAGVYIYTDAYFNKWDAPAGQSRGKIPAISDCAFSPTAKEAEKIYLQGWNYAVSYPLEGIVAEGQKTFQLRKTAFDRVNVRRLFLYLEKEVSRIAKYFLYEGNNEYQRNRFVDAIKPIFNSAVNHNGIVEYYIKCDAENNPAEVIDRNELHCAIAVKPVKSIEFIVLTFVCTNQSATVTESLAGT